MGIELSGYEIEWVHDFVGMRWSGNTIEMEWVKERVGMRRSGYRMK